MTERRAAARESIQFHVWSGYYTQEEVYDIVDEEVFDADDDDEAWLRRAVAREFRLKRRTERSWPVGTNCDRLGGVFQSLQSHGILTRHRCGLTVQDGLAVIDGLYAEAGGEQSKFNGYAFYHLRDMETAMWEDGLWLAFGSFPPSPERASAIGQLVREEFERARFPVEWDGTCESRLLLRGFRWQRRSPGR